MTIRKWKRKLDEMLYWGYIITLLHESYMILAICAFINLAKPSYEETPSKISTILSIVTIIILCIYPIFLNTVLYRNSLDLEKPRLKRKLGSAYEGLRTKNKGYLAYNSFFLYRRLIIPACVVLLNSNYLQQIIIFQFSVLARFVLIGHFKPFKLKRANN